MSYDFKGRAKLAVALALEAEERTIDSCLEFEDPLTTWFYRWGSLSESRDLWLRALINFLFWVRDPVEVSKQYNIAGSTVSRICSGKMWK